MEMCFDGPGLAWLGPSPYRQEGVGVWVTRMGGLGMNEGRVASADLKSVELSRMKELLLVCRVGGWERAMVVGAWRSRGCRDC